VPERRQERSRASSRSRHPRRYSSAHWRRLPTVAKGCAPLSDIEHVVIFINENRSFDSYFGDYRGVRWFRDPNVLPLHDGSGKSIFAQPFPGPAGEPYGGHLLPFHFDTTNGGECVNDISHEWKELHECWSGASLDKFLEAHPKANPKDGHNTMGYYTRQDLPLFHALAENFTLARRTGVLEDVRPHLLAPVPGDALRPGSTELERLAKVRHG
jgi:phospholipase C